MKHAEWNDIKEFASEVMVAEGDKVTFEEIAEASNADYYVKPTYVSQYDGAPNICYGIFNRETQVMEADTRQISAAIEWANVLQRMKNEGPPEPVVRSVADHGGMLN
jgi:SepF-like predicted cell division protein (DUF552 family)